MNIAEMVRRSKERRPQDYCAEPKCLWRIQTRTGVKPCPKHGGLHGATDEVIGSPSDNRGSEPTL